VSLLALELAPALQVWATDDGMRLHRRDDDHDGVLRAAPAGSDLLALADHLWWQQVEEPGHPLGWVGWVAWEAGRFFDPALPPAPQDLPFPVVRMDEVLAGIVAPREGPAELVVVGATDAEADARWTRWQGWLARDSALPPVPPRLTLLRGPEQEAHARAVRATVEDIHAGRVFQACLTHGWHLEDPGPCLASLTLALRARHPGDFATWLRMGEVGLAGVSPEQFFRVEGDRILARPMKGTRPRRPGHEDADREALRLHPKDRAENVMIVDLLRNDLGRVCQPGTVRVPALFEVETYATVHQMTSRIEGVLRPDVGPFRVLQALFPPGSMSGAPRVEACRLIAAREEGPRGLYAGSVGWIRGGRAWSFGVVIRSLQRWPGHASWWTGGGIVADSAPDTEWAESCAKFAALAPLVEEVAGAPGGSFKGSLRR
jgi:para-aminobenzoate synthetase component 1/para-aminobenzoate synthetase